MCARGCRPCGRCQSKDISIDLASHDYMRDKAEVLHTQSLHVGLFYSAAACVVGTQLLLQKIRRASYNVMGSMLFVLPYKKNTISILPS